MRRQLLPVLALALVLGACSSDASSDSTSDDDTTAVKPSAPAPDESEEAGVPLTAEASIEVSCTRFPEPRRKSLATGARPGVTIDTVAYAAEVGDDADGYLAVALNATKDGQTEPVVLAAPVNEGEGLTLATDSALPYLDWGDMAGEGSMADALRDTVGNSNAAQLALACLWPSTPR